MRAIYMGQKRASAEGLKYLAEKGIDVAVVVAPPEGELAAVAYQYRIPIVTDGELYRCLGDGKEDFGGIDLVISFGFWKRIKKPLIELPRIGCINFHPAPLPDFRGMGGVYNFAIYEGLKEWGVSAHFVDETFDTGDLIKVVRFPIDTKQETAFSLRQKSHEALLGLFKEVLDTVRETGSLPRIPQGEGRYISRQDFEALRKIQPSDTLDEIGRKIRAFWCPPWNGAYVELHGREFTLVNEKLLREIGKDG